MTREEAIKLVKRIKGAMVYTEEEKEALETLIPELKETEDERIRKALINLVSTVGEYYLPRLEGRNKMLAYLEKQKENIEKEYVFRPLAGTDITIAAEQAIRRADEGDRLVLAFNGAYIPVRKGCNANKIVDIYDAFIEKQKDASKAIEAVDRIDKYIDEHLANAHDMKDSNPDKKYYRGWDDALGEMARILQDVYSGEESISFNESYIPNDYEVVMEGNATSIRRKQHEPAEEPGKDKDFSDCLTELACELYECHDKSDSPEDTSIKEYQVLEKWEPILLDKAQIRKSAEWSEEDSDNLERVDNYLWMLDDYVGDDCAMPQGKTDKIRGNIQEVLSPWLKNLSERFNLQPKTKWSKEDEKIYTFVYDFFENCWWNETWDISREQVLKTLKSLRPSWKPSEHQMNILKAVKDYVGKGSGYWGEALGSLIDDLEKLT